MHDSFTRSEISKLKQLASLAHAAELNVELRTLNDNFLAWSKEGISPFELVELIHQFHAGASRDIYNRYANHDPLPMVARAVANGVLSRAQIDESLLTKITSEIDYFVRIKQ